MRNDWILDVLTDLKTFASANGLAALAEQLDDTTLIAAAEIASLAGEGDAKGHGEYCRTGPGAGAVGRRRRA